MKRMTAGRRFSLLFIIVSCCALPALAQVSRVVFETRSEFERITVLDLPNGYRQMIFDGRLDGTDAVQSEINKTKPNDLTLAYSRHMMTALPLVRSPDHILVVGLGGACIQRYLHSILPDAVIETAELDPAVLEVAKKYFNLVESDHQKISIGDGRKFIEKSKDKYDLIMLDAFSATSIPYMLATREFLTLCRDHLRAGGVVCANLWYEAPDYFNMLKTYDAVFPEWHVMRCPRSTNAILVALPEKRGLTPEQWMDAARAFEGAHGMNLKLAEMVDHAIEQATRVPTDAVVLLDADAAKHK